MIFIGPFFSAFIIGFLILANILKDSRLPHRKLLAMILAAPVGLGTCSTALFWAYCAASSQGKWLSVIFIYLLGAYALFRLITAMSKTQQKPIFARMEPAALKALLNTRNFFHVSISAAALIVLGFVLYHFIRYFISTSCLEIYGGWDARFIWNLKAKFFFRSPAEWTGMFRNELAFSHPDYPLLLPGAVAWGWNWAGKEILIWPALIAFIFMICTGLFILWHLLASTNPWSAFLACSYFGVAGAYRFWAPTQYADIPLCFFITASGGMLLAAVRARENPLFLLSGLLAGMAAWTKNEGLFFLAWLVLIFFAALAVNAVSRPDKKKAAIFFTAGLSIPLLNILCLKTFYAKGGDYLGSGRTAAEYFSLTFKSADKTKAILEGFQTYMTRINDWNGLWVLFFAALLIAGFAGWKILLNKHGWILAAAAILTNFGYFLVLHTTPHEIHWQMETALTRLLLHSGGLALIFVFEVFSSFWPETELRP